MKIFKKRKKKTTIIKRIDDHPLLIELGHAMDYTGTITIDRHTRFFVDGVETDRQTYQSHTGEHGLSDNGIRYC